MGIRQNMEEKEIEAHLDAHISQYLLELGKGFTYYGHQVHLNVGGEDFYIDQLFYNVLLHCYVVVELKTVKFKPEHIGQLNFYVSAVDNQMRADKDNPTIGLLICKDKNSTSTLLISIFRSVNNTPFYCVAFISKTCKNDSKIATSLLCWRFY